jgi:hypothetical protein
VFLLFSSIPLVYEQYGFSVGETGCVLVTVIIGALFGMFAARWQDRLYHRDGKLTPHGRAPPESRLYGACVSVVTYHSLLASMFNAEYPQAGGLIVPISLLWFAWGGRPSVHWIVPTIALVFFNFGIL